MRKFTDYEQAGVREYWIIDPRPHQRQIDFYRLDQSQRFQAAPLDAQGHYHSQVLPHFWLNPNWLWQTPRPNPQLAWVEIMLSITGLSAETKATFQSLQTLLSKL